MIPEKIMLQSAGSLSVAVLALLMMVLQIIFFFRKPQFACYGWSAAISLSAMIYAIGIFLEYNTPAGPINQCAGLLEWTAIIFLIHFVYGFTFACLGMDGKYYHLVAGIFHGFVLILLWFTNVIVADRFVSRDFIGMTQPFVELDLGPLGPLFMIYAISASIGSVVLWWIRYKGTNSRRYLPFLAGVGIWIILGIHDALAVLGIQTFQYVMEYGFFAFSLTILGIVFKSFVDVSVEDKYRTITEFANDGILVIQNRKTVFANPACSALMGLNANGSTVEDILNLVTPEKREILLARFRSLGNSVGRTTVFTFRIERAKDVDETYEIKASVIRYRGKPAVLCIFRDITERIREEDAVKEKEEKLSRLKKMESLGLLAGGVAHDLNNVLSGVVSYPELILLDLPEGGRLRKWVEAIHKSGKRAAAIVQDLLTVARGVVVPREPLNLNDVVGEYLSSPEHQKLQKFHPEVTVSVDLDDELMNVEGSSVHIWKVVMNLVSNAAEAVKNGGNIVVSTVNRVVDRPLKGYCDVAAGEYAVLATTDDGPGLPPEDLKRIFEPFYSKKVLGRSGTGLGLTLVWNILQDHEGYIDVMSGPEGTRFELYFPLTGKTLGVKTSSALPRDIYGHGEMILIIDDVKSQREISGSMLQALGYRTAAVSGGEEAIDYLKKNRVDLLLLDMVMEPGMDGRETYERITGIHPKQKAIIVSGFAETDPVKETLKLGAGQYLRKPLTLELLGLAVKAELAK